MQKVRPPRPDRLHPTTSARGGANSPNPETAESQPPFTCEPTGGQCCAQFFGRCRTISRVMFRWLRASVPNNVIRADYASKKFDFAPITP